MKARATSRIISLLLLLSFCVPLLTGCWDRLEIEERAVVLAIAIDKASKKDLENEPEVSRLKGTNPQPDTHAVKLTAQIAVPGRIPLGPGDNGGGSSSQKPVWVLSATGYTIEDAMMVLQQQLADRLFLGHLRVIVVSEKVARDGLENINDYLRRNAEVRRLAWLSVSIGRAERIMRAAPQLERVPGLYLLALFDHAVEMGKYPNEFIGVYWSKTSSKGIEPILPVLSMKKSGDIEIAGLAYFKGDKLEGKSKPLEIGFYMAVTNVKRGGYTGYTKAYPNSEDLIMVKATHRKTSLKVSLVDGKPHVDIHVFLEEIVQEKLNESFTIDKQKSLDMLAAQSAKFSQEGISKFIAKTQRAGSDIFGFGEQFRGKLPGYWNREVRNESKWEEIFKTVTVDVHAEVRMRRVGTKAK